jgi:hypothetical protein
MSVPPTFSEMFWTGPFAWNGVLTYWVTVILYAIWLTTAMVLIFRQLRRDEVATPARSSAAVGTSGS